MNSRPRKTSFWNKQTAEITPGREEEKSPLSTKLALSARSPEKHREIETEPDERGQYFIRRAIPATKNDSREIKTE